MSDIDDLNDLENLEDEDFKAKKIKKKKEKTPDNKESEGEISDKNIFVTNNPSKSTAYKDKLLKVYAELEAITDEEIQTEIDSLKQQVLDLLSEKNESDERLRALKTKELDKTGEIEKDLHYLRTSKEHVIEKAKDNTLFTPTNILLSLCFVAFLVLIIVLFCKL